MLDKLSRSVLDYMESVSGNPDITERNYNQAIYTIADAVSSDPVKVRECISFLKKNDYITTRYSGKGHPMGFRLAHKGFHHREFSLLETRERWAERFIGVIMTLLTEILIIGAGYGMQILISVR